MLLKTRIYCVFFSILKCSLKYKQIVYINLRGFSFSKAFSATESTLDVKSNETEAALSAGMTCALMIFCPRLVLFSFSGPMCNTRTLISVFFVMQSGWLNKSFKGISPCRNRIRIYGIFNEFDRFVEF